MNFKFYAWINSMKNHYFLEPVVIQSPGVQDTFQPIPGFISRAGVNVGTTHHAHAEQVAGMQMY